MPKTIQFCGDSICADTCSNSWTTVLAGFLGATLIGKGRGGTAYENIFNTFNSNATYSVFCWTDAHRLHLHDIDYDINYATALADRKKSLHHAAALAYFKVLYNAIFYIFNSYWIEIVQRFKLTVWIPPLGGYFRKFLYFFFIYCVTFHT